MTARSTSIDTYREIVSEGLLSPARLAIYQAIWKNGPMTSGETFEFMHMAGSYSRPLSQSRARFTELRELGALREAGSRACGVSGRHSIVWETTGDRPTKPAPKPARDLIDRQNADRIRELEIRVEKLERENQDLRNRIHGKPGQQLELNGAWLAG